MIKVTGNGLLQTGGCSSKLSGFLQALTHQSGVDESGCKGISSTHPVYNMDIILCRSDKFIAIIQDYQPAVIGGTTADAQMAAYQLQAKPIYQLLSNTLKSIYIYLALFNIRTTLDTKDHLGILFIGDTDIHIFHHFRHYLSSPFFAPEL